ncbi:MAG: DUF4261 domain-containing protein [Deltaproteobacteria bacterium]|jgi:hypothetical protein
MVEPAFRVRLLFDAASAPPSTAGLRVRSVDALDADTLARAVQAAWYWPEAEETLERLTHALEVSLEAPPEDDLEHAVALTKLAAELGKTAGARAYLWEATSLVHDASAFTDQASDASVEDLPLYLWIAFEAREDEPGKISLLTRGLSSFDRPEVEVDRSARALEEILEVVTDVALYVLTASTPLEDGETLEVTLGKVRVRTLPSLRNDGSRALRARLP